MDAMSKFLAVQAFEVGACMGGAGDPSATGATLKRAIHGT